MVEDIDRPEGRDEAALFHLLNLVRERGSPVLFTSGKPIDSLGIATPDLRSRLRLAPGVAIDAPDDALLRAVLVKTVRGPATHRGSRMIEAVALRIDRSLGRAREVVAELDRDALGTRAAYQPTARRLRPAPHGPRRGGRGFGGLNRHCHRTVVTAPPSEW